jgi:hypothetical protein
LLAVLYRGSLQAFHVTLSLKKEVIPSIANLLREPPTTHFSFYTLYLL